VIHSLPVTILIEGFIVAVYAALTKKPAGILLRASFIANVFTQVVLWIALGIFFRRYLPVLIAAEVCIWLLESLLMIRLSGNRLTSGQSILLSLCMNLGSFGLGLLLPI
jgi:hypothetical protein